MKSKYHHKIDVENSIKKNWIGAKEIKGAGHGHEQTAMPERIERIRQLGGGSYQHIRVLEDGTIVAIGSLLYTTAVYVGIDEIGWNKRFCFDDIELAKSQYKALSCASDEPCGWIARRPQEPEDDKGMMDGYFRSTPKG